MKPAPVKFFHVYNTDDCLLPEQSRTALNSYFIYMSIQDQVIVFERAFSQVKPPCKLMPDKTDQTDQIDKERFVSALLDSDSDNSRV